MLLIDFNCLTRTAILAIVYAGMLLANSLGMTLAAERIVLTDDEALNRTYSVTSQLKVEGKVFPQPGAKSALNLTVDAGFRYLERQREGSGRQAQSLRAVRFYEAAGASIKAGLQVSNADLRPDCALIVAEGAVAGIDLWSPSSPLRYDELELLRTAGDSLAINALFSEQAVEPDDEWKPANWVLPLLTGLEAVEKSQFTCRYLRNDGDLAIIQIAGEITGAVLGAAAKITVDGEVHFHLKDRYWVKMTLSQKEKRAVGAVSPGLDLTATVTSTRRIAKAIGKLDDKSLKGVPLVSNDASRLIAFESDVWKLRILHDRNWHLLTQNSDGAFFRRLDKGELLGQCSLKNLPRAEPGKHVSEEVFQKDIEKGLGKNFEKFLQAERLKIGGNLFVYRVSAVGSVPTQDDKNQEILTPMQWNYYLIAHPDGRQVSLVFSVTPELMEKFNNSDLGLVGGIEFLASKTQLSIPNRKP